MRYQPIGADPLVEQAFTTYGSFTGLGITPYPVAVLEGNVRCSFGRTVAKVL